MKNIKFPFIGVIIFQPIQKENSFPFAPMLVIGESETDCYEKVIDMLKSCAKNDPYMTQLAYQKIMAAVYDGNHQYDTDKSSHLGCVLCEKQFELSYTSQGLSIKTIMHGPTGRKVLNEEFV